MLATVVGIFVLIVWWTLALLIGFWRVKPEDSRYHKRGPSVGAILIGGAGAVLFALVTHEKSGE